MINSAINIIIQLAFIGAFTISVKNYDKAWYVWLPPGIIGLALVDLYALRKHKK